MMLRSRGSDSVWSAVIGTTVGVAATAATLWWVRGRRRDGRWTPELERTDLERAVRGALRTDEELGRRGVMVTELGPGVVEMAGVVRTEDESHRAVELANRVPGVHTVVNRLTPRDLETHLAETRERFRRGDADLVETRWTGLGVGMGRRRQSPDTDPARRDDHAKLLERELRANRVVEEELNGEDRRSADWSVPQPREDVYEERSGGAPN